MRVLIDTTVLIDFLRGRESAVLLLERAAQQFETVFVSAMNVAEIYGGIRPGEETRVARLVGNLNCLPVTLEIARWAGQMQADAARRGRTIALADLIVTATAMTHGCAIATANRKDFEIDGVRFWPA